MSRELLASRLLSLPERLRQEEEGLAVLEASRNRARAQLQAEEDCHVLSGHASGKNQAERDAQLRALTAAARRDLEGVEEQFRRESIQLRHLQNEFAALRAVARLLAREEE